MTPDAVINRMNVAAVRRKTQEHHAWHGNRYGGAGVEFRGSGITRIAYNKHGEVCMQLAKGKIDWSRCSLTAEQLENLAVGVIRWEMQITSRAIIKRLLGGDATLGGLLTYLGDNDSSYAKTAWDAYIVEGNECGQSIRLRLEAAHSRCTARGLMDTLSHIHAHGGVDEYVRCTGIDRSALWRLRQALQIAGVSASAGCRSDAEQLPFRCVSYGVDDTASPALCT